MIAAFKCTRCDRSAYRMWDGDNLCREHYEVASTGFRASTVEPDAAEAQQQLVARIKRGSKYWGQTEPNAWFDVRVVEDNYYQLRGNSNNYRLSDVVCGIRLASGAIVDFGKGRIDK